MICYDFIIYINNLYNTKYKIIMILIQKDKTLSDVHLAKYI